MSRRSRKHNRTIKEMENKKMKKIVSERNQEQNNGGAADWTEVRRLPVSMLQVDPKYQRQLDRGWAKYIAANYDPDLVKQVQVSQRDGAYWVFDGQHTVTAIRMKFHDPNFPVVCKIYHGLTEEEEGRLFYKYNNCSKKMSSASMLKAQAFYGDETVQSFLEHTKAQGFLIDPTRRVTGQYGIQAVKKAQTIFEKMGAEMYDRILSLLKNTWNGAPWSVSQNMLGGMAALMKIFGDKLDDKKFVSQLKKITEDQLIREAGRYTEESVSVAYASALVYFYNKGLRNGKLKRVLLLED